MTWLTAGRVVLGIVGVAWAAALVVLVTGTFLPRLPVIGFVGSFVSGQYPLHAAFGALVGVAIGAGLFALGAGRTGVVVGSIGVVAVVGTVVVLVAQARVVAAQGARVDWGLALTAVDQSGNRAAPDLVARYSDDPPLDVEVHLPAGPGPHPVMVWVHGGSWVRGERTDRRRANRWFADRGLATVSVTYRLPDDVGGAPVGAGQRRDVACALAWVRGPEGAALGLDGAALTLAGQSAGATLALSTTAALAGAPAAAMPGPAAGGCATAPPAATVGFYPVVDMRLIAPGLQRAVFGGPTSADPAATRAASPVDLVSPELPPTMVVLGAADNFVRADLIRAHERALRAAGVPGPLLQIPYADHVFDHPFGSLGAQAARPAVLAFVRERAWARHP